MSDSAPTFLETVDRLTIETHLFVDRDDGKQLVTRPGLLPQLREAVRLGMETGGGSSSAFGTRPPLDAGASDLLTEISRQAHEAFTAAVKDIRPTTPESTIRRWFAAVTNDTMITVRVSQQHSDDMVNAWYRKHQEWMPAVYYRIEQLPAWMLARRWVDQIELFFNPPSTREIQGACPACDATHVHRVKDGVTVQSRALAFIRNPAGDPTEARCAACGVRWLPFQFEWLAQAVGAKPLPELVSDTPERV